MVCLPNAFDFGRHEERRMDEGGAYWHVGIPSAPVYFRSQ